MHAASVTIAMAAGMVTNCRISHFLYAAAAMNAGAAARNLTKRRTPCSSGSLRWPSPIEEHVGRGFTVPDASAGTGGEP